MKKWSMYLVLALSASLSTSVLGAPFLGSLFLTAVQPATAQEDPVPEWGSAGYNWAGDFNGDGLDDIASALPNGSMIMRMSNGSQFERQNWSVPTQWGGSNYTWAEDFDGDGKTDLVSALENNIFVHMPMRDGFRSLTLETTNRWGEPGYNWTGDFNGDGLLDIASAHPNGEVTLRLFNGSDFDLETWSVSTQWGGSRYTWAEDFNNDGKTDLTSALEGNLFIHLSQGSGFSSSTLEVPLNWGDPGYNWSGNFNSGGLVDLVSAHPNGDMTMRWLDVSATGVPSFEFTTWSVPTRWGGSNYTWAEDFNGDGKTDFVSAHLTDTFIHLTEGDRFQSKTIEIVEWGEPGQNLNGDFNGDGQMDLAAILQDQTVSLRLSTGDNFDVSPWETVTARPRLFE